MTTHFLIIKIRAGTEMNFTMNKSTSPGGHTGRGLRRSAATTTTPAAPRATTAAAADGGAAVPVSERRGDRGAAGAAPAAATARRRREPLHPHPADAPETQGNLKVEKCWLVFKFLNCVQQKILKTNL